MLLMRLFLDPEDWLRGTFNNQHDRTLFVSCTPYTFHLMAGPIFPLTKGGTVRSSTAEGTFSIGIPIAISTL